jgi:hypothetical protein
MKSSFTFFIILIFYINIIYSNYSFSNFFKNKNDAGLREWLKKLIISLPDFEFEFYYNISVKNLRLDSIALDLINSKYIYSENKTVGLKLELNNIGLHLNSSLYINNNTGMLDLLVSKLNFTLPFKLIKNQTTGLICNVSTDGLIIELEESDVEIKVEGNSTEYKIINNLLYLFKKVLLKKLVDDSNYLISKIVSSEFTELFNKANNLILNGTQPIPLNITFDKFSDLRKSSLIDTTRFLLNNFTGADGPLNFNNIINNITNNTGIIYLHDFYNDTILFSFNVTDKNNNSLGYLEIGLKDLNISDLNTWEDINALIPNKTSPYLLDSFTNLNALGINISFSIKVVLEKEGGIVTSDAELYEEAELVTRLVNNKLWAQLQLPIKKGKASTYSSKQCLNLGCILDLFDKNGTGINSLSLIESFQYINIQHGEGDLEEDVDLLLDQISTLFVGAYNDKIPIFINAIINSTIIDLINGLINTNLYQQTCPPLKDVVKKELNITFTSIAVITALVIFFIIIFNPYIKDRKKLQKQHESQLNSVRLSDTSEDNSIRLSEPLNIIGAKYISCFGCLKEFGRTDPDGASLFLNPNISIFWRIFIPFAILINITMFISSNSSIGASVYAVLYFQKRIEIPSLFDFGLINSVTDMWKAKVYPLSILIAFFSGIWPYVKLIMMLISFITPSSLINKNKRSTILMILDATGKWSILDSYVMILMLVAFQFHVVFPIVSETVEEASIVDIYVDAAYGFVTLLIATCLSLALSHIITHLHRGLDEHPNENKGEKAESFKSLISYANVNGKGKYLFRGFITLILFTTLSFVIYGELIISFSFDFLGLAGYGLGLLNIKSHREYSVLNLGLKMPDAYEIPNSFSIRFTQLIYFLTIMIFPICHLLTVIILWLVPLSRKIQKFIYTICEILNAWSCIDVFVISIIAAIVEISQFTAFIVGDKCDFINPFLAKFFDNTLNGHDTCFEVEAYLQSGCWILFAAAIMYFIGSMVVMKVCRNALYERLPPEAKEYVNSMKNKNKSSNELNQI